MSRGDIPGLAYFPDAALDSGRTFPAARRALTGHRPLARLTEDERGCAVTFRRRQPERAARELLHVLGEGPAVWTLAGHEEEPPTPLGC